MIRFRVAAAVAVAVLVASSTTAWACPTCIGKNASLPPSLKLVGLFLLVPFAVFAIFLLILRRANRRERASRP